MRTKNVYYVSERLSDHDDGVNNVANLYILHWKIEVLHALHVHFSFLYISFSFYQRREITCFAVVCQTIYTILIQDS